MSFHYLVIRHLAGKRKTKPPPQKNPLCTFLQCVKNGMTLIAINKKNGYTDNLSRLHLLPPCLIKQKPFDPHLNRLHILHALISILTISSATQGQGNTKRYWHKGYNSTTLGILDKSLYVRAEIKEHKILTVASTSLAHEQMNNRLHIQSKRIKQERNRGCRLTPITVDQIVLAVRYLK